MRLALTVLSWLSLRAPAAMGEGGVRGRLGDGGDLAGASGTCSGTATLAAASAASAADSCAAKKFWMRSSFCEHAEGPYTD